MNWLPLLLLLIWADLVLTMVGLQRGAVEVNPLVTTLPWMILVKLLLSALALVATARFSSRILIPLIVFYSIVVAINTFVVATILGGPA